MRLISGPTISRTTKDMHDDKKAKHILAEGAGLLSYEFSLIDSIAGPMGNPVFGFFSEVADAVSLYGEFHWPDVSPHLYEAVEAVYIYKEKDQHGFTATVKEIQTYTMCGFEGCGHNSGEVKVMTQTTMGLYSNRVFDGPEYYNGFGD